MLDSEKSRKKRKEKNNICTYKSLSQRELQLQLVSLHGSRPELACYVVNREKLAMDCFMWSRTRTYVHPRACMQLA
jgi:hypothetical protein